jgi:hypothetical protein
MSSGEFFQTLVDCSDEQLVSKRCRRSTPPWLTHGRILKWKPN